MDNVSEIVNVDGVEIESIQHQELLRTTTPEQTCSLILDHFIQKDNPRYDTVEQALIRDQVEVRLWNRHQIGMDVPDFRHVTKDEVSAYRMHKIKIKRAAVSILGILLA